VLLAVTKVDERKTAATWVISVVWVAIVLICVAIGLAGWVRWQWTHD
jgi:hypothetical protein